MTERHIVAGVLDIAYEESGDTNGWPVVLLHGFPYDVRTYDDAVPKLADAGARVIVPYLRGYGPTRFLADATMRSGQQGALAADLLAMLDALEIPRAILAGYDWGGRAACIVAALFPQRVRGLVTLNGYNIQNIAAAREPAIPDDEHRLWYQYYFHGERGRAGLTRDRRAFCKLLWRLWSPSWPFDDATFERTAVSFDNPDFIDVVIHSYRHRFGLIASDPAYDDIERALALSPAISVPTISFRGGTDGVLRSNELDGIEAHFTAFFEHRVVGQAGHNLPREAPLEFARAIRDLREAHR